MPCTYVVKACVPLELAEPWIAWMRETHIPKLLAIQGFRTAQIAAVEDEATTVRTFAIAYALTSREALDTYLRSPQCTALRAESAARFGDAVHYSREIWSSPE